MHRYPLGVVHHWYMLHDDMYNEVDRLSFDRYLRINIQDLGMFVDDDDSFVLKENSFDEF